MHKACTIQVGNNKNAVWHRAQQMIYHSVRSECSKLFEYQFEIVSVSMHSREHFHYYSHYLRLFSSLRFIDTPKNRRTLRKHIAIDTYIMGFTMIPPLYMVSAV